MFVLGSAGISSEFEHLWIRKVQNLVLIRMKFGTFKVRFLPYLASSKFDISLQIRSSNFFGGSDPTQP